MIATNTRPMPPAPNQQRGPTGRTIVRWCSIGVVALLVAGGVIVGMSHRASQSDITAHELRIKELATAAGPVPVDASAITELPEPVQRWIEFTFDDPAAADGAYVEFGIEGDFRRPLTDGFNPLTGSQTTAINEPALVFSGTTTVFPGLWALAYDAYADGGMEMKAKILSTITVVDETETPELNQTSLQRWLLMTPLYPTALLPGGQVSWEPVDAGRARASVEAHGSEASLLFTFADDGSISQIDAETDGDLTTSYHGAGEHLAVDDYRRLDGVMLPHDVVVARAADGVRFPFLDGVITGYTFHP
ncbi:MAG: DUF6920 family protein [Acidimicrobiales bacterium]